MIITSVSGSVIAVFVWRVPGCVDSRVSLDASTVVTSVESLVMSGLSAPIHRARSAFTYYIVGNFRGVLSFILKGVQI